MALVYAIWTIEYVITCTPYVYGMKSRAQRTAYGI